MAKQRYINTKFWTDDYIATLDPIEKLLYLYFFTNPFANICGVYELSILHVALETGIEKGMVVKIQKRFEKDGRVFYHNGYVHVKNFVKNQSLNPKILKGIHIALGEIPEDILRYFNIAYDRLSEPTIYLNLNTNTKKNDFEIQNLPLEDIKKQIMDDEITIEAVDEHGYPTTPKKKGLPVNKSAFYLQRLFIDTAEKELGTRPIWNKGGYVLICRALKNFTLEELEIAIKDWFDEPKPDDDLIQITQCLSDNRLNRWKINQ